MNAANANLATTQAALKALTTNWEFEQNFRNMTVCGNFEGDVCLCNGRVFYGEKYDRVAVDAQGGQTNGLERLSFLNMVKYPYMTVQWRDQSVYSCDFDNVFSESDYRAPMMFTGKYEKQCYCEDNTLPSNANDGTWKY